MIGFIRSLFQSRIGVIVTLAFVALIALAFASSDITGSNFGGVAGGDRAASVGGQTIGTAALNQAVTNAFDGARQENPTLTMQRFVAAGGLDEVLESLIDRSAIYEFGRRHGILASDALVGSEIVKIPAFRGPDGQFSETAYRQLLRQQGLSDKTVREDLAQGLVAKQVLVPVAFGATSSNGVALRYAQLARERRKGQIALIPSAAFAPTAAPTDAELATFYKANRAAYTLPERRVIRYATFGDEALKDLRAPTEAEIASAYAANKAKYAASETRRLTQVIVPTEAAAKALENEVRGGKALEAAARAKGLLANPITVTREALTGQSSAAVAAAAFGADNGALSAPARSALGWHVIRVDGITRTASRGLAEAKAELTAELVAKKRRDALIDVTARIEEELEGGSNLGDIAKQMGLTVSSTQPLLANGRVFGNPTATAPAELARVLQVAFLMESENQPQLAEIDPGKRFIVFDVADITPSAPPPLAQIKARVASDWARAQGAIRARAAAEKAIAALAKGGSLSDALRSAGAAAASIQSVDAKRQDLFASGRVTPPLALLFSMAEGSTKRLAAPGRAGWYVVRLDDIEPGQVAANDPGLPGLARELGQSTGREYAEQFRRALRDELGVERNPPAVRAVRERLTGGGN
jgi:peptidyl-prolyl cis-trans isomerase D